MENTK
jgi:hypothetical protein